MYTRVNNYVFELLQAVDELSGGGAGVDVIVRMSIDARGRDLLTCCR